MLLRNFNTIIVTDVLADVKSLLGSAIYDSFLFGAAMSVMAYAVVLTAALRYLEVHFRLPIYKANYWAGR